MVCPSAAINLTPAAASEVREIYCRYGSWVCTMYNYEIPTLRGCIMGVFHVCKDGGKSEHLHCEVVWARFSLLQS